MVGTFSLSGVDQVKRNAKTILLKSDELNNVAAEAENLGPCQISTAGVRKGRPTHGIWWTNLDGQRVRKNFRSYHITWAAEYGRIPSHNLNLQYSHRCHKNDCVEARHGVWEGESRNIGRNACVGRSHLVLPDGTCILQCTHDPPCLSAKVIESWEDPMVVRRPQNQ